ncbi:MAG: hypothetical protein IPJ18_05235 [Betaproteobacteria bacterium]|nr:hypothetical protein [Betaproteobacteria bacterium]
MNTTIDTTVGTTDFQSHSLVDVSMPSEIQCLSAEGSESWTGDLLGKSQVENAFAFEQTEAVMATNDEYLALVNQVLSERYPTTTFETIIRQRKGMRCPKSPSVFYLDPK